MRSVENLPDLNYKRDTIRKHSSVIAAHHVKDINFRPEDLTFFNYLLLRTSTITQPHGIYQVPVKDIMDFMKFDRASKVHESLDRLCRGNIEVDYIDQDGTERSLRAHYLSHDSSRAETGYIKFAFDPILVHFLIEPKVYALISVNRSNDIKSFAGKRLYELASLQRQKRTPVWKVSVEEFREIVDMVDRHPRFDNFRRNVIEKAITEVNAIADFEILFDVMTGGAGGSATMLEFTVVDKSHSRLLQSKMVKSTKAKRGNGDKHTVDMLDGLTAEERGGPAELTSEAIDKASALLPADEDINDWVAEWREQNRGLSLIDPDGRFLSYVELKLMKKNDPVLSTIIDDEIFYNILNPEEQ